MNKEDGQFQVSSLIYAMGPEAENIFKSFTFGEKVDKKKFNVVLVKYLYEMSEHCDFSIKRDEHI